MILASLPGGFHNWQVFTPANPGVGSSRFRQWLRPPGTSLVCIIAVGGGGAGGAGQSGAGTARGGGGGGASGNIARVIVPAFALPDIIFVTAGTASLSSHVTLAPNFSADARILLASGGNDGTAGSGGTGGAAGAATSANTVGLFASTGIFNSVAGVAGVAGGSSSASGNPVTIGSTIPLTGGAGGGGIDSGDVTSRAGGAISASNPATGQALHNAIAGAPANSGALFADGSPGRNHAMPLDVMISRNIPLFFTGGSGGASRKEASGIGGGNGGHGAWGCGGGGGGAGSTGGAGGRGGDGFVLIGVI